MRSFPLLLLVACAGSAASSESTSPPQSAGAEEPHVNPHHGHRPGHHHDFSDVARFEAIFDTPDRDEWQRPQELVALMTLPADARVVDLGAGTGYFLRHLAAAVPRGEVLALDVEPAMVAHMRERVAREGLTNVEVRAIDPDDPGLPPASVDAILIVDTWHHLADRSRYAARLKRALRPGGALWIVDFTRDAPDGPPPEMRLDPEQVLAELRAAGLQAEVVDAHLPRQYVIRAH